MATSFFPSQTVDLTTGQTLTNKTLTLPVINSGFNDQTGTTYTFVLSDNGKIVTSSNASAQTFSIPTDATSNFAVGAQITVLQIGSAQVTIQAADAGTTTVLSNGTVAAAPKTRTQYSSITCIKKSANLWYCLGDFA